MIAHKRAGYFIHAEAAQNMQHQRHLRLLGQSRMAAGEHHAQLIVFDRVRREEFFDGGPQRPFGFEPARQFRRESQRGALAPQNIERTILRRRHQPRRRIFRRAAKFPNFQRAAEGVLHHVFCQRQIVNSENSRKRGHHAARLAPEKMLVKLHYIFMTGRTSTAPPVSKIGQPSEISTACAISFASTSE